MFGLMVTVAFDVLVLVGLMVVLSGEAIGIGQAAIISLIFSIGVTILSIALAAAMGLAGVFVAALIAAAILGAVISAMFGMEIKRALAVGAIFVVVHVAFSIGFALLMRPTTSTPETVLESSSANFASRLV